MSRRRAANDRLAGAVRRLARRRAGTRRDAAPAPSDDLAGRLDRLERDLGELRGRITALFLTVVGVALTEFLTRVAG